MIRGINRQIIDVQETGSSYYERAYFVVKPEFASAQQQLLEKEAKKILKSIDAPAHMKRVNSKIAWTVRLLASAGAGAGIMALFAYLL